MKQDIKSLSYEELEQALLELNQPKFRAKQVFTWLHRGVKSFSEMTNLSKDLRQLLDKTYVISVPQVERKQESRRDGKLPSRPAESKNCRAYKRVPSQNAHSTAYVFSRAGIKFRVFVKI